MTSEQHRKAFCSNVARILSVRRIELELSMTQIAERSGLSQQMVSYVEREIRIPGIDTLLRIAEALELDIVEIVREADRRSKE